MRKHRFAGAALVGVALGIALAGCGGDNDGNPVGFFPVGTTGTAYLFTSAFPFVPEDSTTGFLVATVLAPPPADGFRLYLNPGDQGYRPASDAPVPPLTTTGAGYNLYSILVVGFDPSVGGTVVARGARGGLETSAAPTTNTSTIPPTHPLALLRRQAVVLSSPQDSAVVTTLTPTLTWQAIPGASYLLSVSLSTGQPIYTVLTSQNSHQVNVSPGVVFENQPIRDNGFYNWSVQALDGGQRVFAVSAVPNAFFVNLPDVP